MLNEMTAEKALERMEEYIGSHGLGRGGITAINSLLVLRAILAENEKVRAELARLKAGPTDDHSAEMLERRFP